MQAKKHVVLSTIVQSNNMALIKVVLKNDRHAVFTLCSSLKRAREWIEKHGDSKTFTDKTLTEQSFTTLKN